MNKNMFWTGLSIFILEALGILIFMLSTLNWNWLDETLIKFILGAFLILFVNGLALIMIFKGITEKDKEEFGGYY